MLETGSRITMALSGWERPASRHEVYTMQLLARVMNFTRGADEPAYTPDWPWPTEQPTPDVSDAERASLKGTLNASSAFAQKRTEA